MCVCIFVSVCAVQSYVYDIVQDVHSGAGVYPCCLYRGLTSSFSEDKLTVTGDEDGSSRA